MQELVSQRSGPRGSFVLPRYYTEEGRLVAFPAGCRGFLYLSKKRLEIRFRVTDNNSPESFKSGADLRRPNRKLWSVPLRAMSKNRLPLLRELLLRHRFTGNALVSLDVNSNHPFINWSVQSPAGPRCKKRIQTLDHSRLCPSDYLNLAGLKQPGISTQHSHFRLTYTGIRPDCTPFPLSARGFLYLWAPAEAANPPKMWQIRFRVTKNESLESFDSGSDLLYPNQTTWSIPLGALNLHQNRYFALRELLVRDGYYLEYLADKTTAGNAPLSSPMIYSLGQVFCVSFVRQGIGLGLGSGEGSAYECRITSPFCIYTRLVQDDHSM